MRFLVKNLTDIVADDIIFLLFGSLNFAPFFIIKRAAHMPQQTRFLAQFTTFYEHRGGAYVKIAIRHLKTRLPQKIRPHMPQSIALTAGLCALRRAKFMARKKEHKT